MQNYRFFIPLFKHIKPYRPCAWSLIELASVYTVPLSAVNGSSRLTTTSNEQARPIRKFLNRPITFESNRLFRFEYKSNLEALQVPKIIVSYRVQNCTWAESSDGQFLQGFVRIWWLSIAPFCEFTFHLRLIHRSTYNWTRHNKWQT